MEYEIKGTPLPVVICKLKSGESMLTESGGMCWMSPNMKMETTSGGGVKKAFGRLFTGESLFLNSYTAERGPGEVAFASRFPGSIIPINIEPDNEMVIQKSGFLAAEEGVDMAVFFRKKLGTGFFGGEGFIMQKLSGRGTAFIEIDGFVVEYELKRDESMLVSTGHLAAMEATCTMDIKSVPGIKNALFGGEGLFNTVVTGPGKVFLQTMPIVNLANEVRKYIPEQPSN